mmetsp:Transcript_53645/g.160137  ORF Transcript_53645/g.160137 Transcript_53645/m.160137 type:complete len:254 (-) Transcript_53645:698-1459(-)
MASAARFDSTRRSCSWRRSRSSASPRVTMLRICRSASSRQRASRARRDSSFAHEASDFCSFSDSASRISAASSAAWASPWANSSQQACSAWSVSLHSSLSCDTSISKVARRDASACSSDRCSASVASAVSVAASASHARCCRASSTQLCARVRELRETPLSGLGPAPRAPCRWAGEASGHGGTGGSVQARKPRTAQDARRRCAASRARARCTPAGEPLGKELPGGFWPGGDADDGAHVDASLGQPRRSPAQPP